VSKRFLVSTTHHLLAIDPEQERIWKVHSGKGLYFGISSGRDHRIYVACRNTTLGADSESVRSSERGSVISLNSCFQVCEELTPPFPARDLHGMAWFDDKLWITCAFDNLIAIYDCNLRSWRRWYPAPDPTQRDRDIHHINTVRLIGNQVFIVAHQFGSSQLMVYDYPTLDLHSSIPLGRMAHDVFSFRGKLATCSSADGYIVNCQGEKLRTGNFPRGVAVSGDGNLLGMSIHACRSERIKQSGILRWYTPEWEFRADYVLPSVGMILDVISIETEQYSWETLEPWPLAEITRGKYNREAAGDTYAPHLGGLWPPMPGSDWHRTEESHCWTAARSASLPIVISPGETRLRIELGSGYPFHYFCEILLNEKVLGRVTFESSGVQRKDFAIGRDSAGERILTLRVPFLWNPAAQGGCSHDERALGVALHSATLIQDQCI
jgi:hypothetical protein